MSNSRSLPPKKHTVVTHLIFGPDGFLPCCGVHRYLAPQGDRVTPDREHVTCDGTKRTGATVVTPVL